MTAKDKETAIAGDANNGGGMRIPWRIGAWAVAVLFLLANVVGNQVSAEVNWTLSDFVFAGVLLFGSLGIYEIAVRTTRNALYQAGVGVAILGALLLTWSNMAVGITDSVADVAYLGVPAVGLVGAVLARFQPAGMAQALFATALAQALITVIVLVAGMVPAHNPMYEVLGVNGIFVVLFVGSAVLFRKAARSGLERGTAMNNQYVHTLASLLTVAVGVVLLVYMISVEGEPGAIPLLLIVGGTGWYFITRA